MPTPAPYPNTDSAEFDAITVFRSLVDSRTVKLDVKERDKFPNIDGTAELVDENLIPLGKVDVQVRKIPTGQTWYDCPTELFAYSEIATVPVLLVCVDVESKIAFWKQVATKLPEYKPEQKSSRLKFYPVVDAVGGCSQFFTRWQEVVADYQSRITGFPILKQRFDEEIGLASLQRTDIIFFQKFIDTLNNLLDVDFVAIKHQFFADVWKLGVGIYGANQNEIYYRIYSILKGRTVHWSPALSENLSKDSLPPLCPMQFRVGSRAKGRSFGVRGLLVRTSPMLKRKGAILCFFTKKNG